MANEDDLYNLWNTTRNDFEIGDFDSFKSKMQDPTLRSSFYKTAGAKYDLGDYGSFESKVLGQPKPNTLQKLPSNMNPQQVKSFFSRAGKTLTDTQAGDIAGMVSGKSYQEAMSLTSGYLAPKITAPVQEQAPLVAAPQPGTGFRGEVEGVQINTTQNQEPDLTFNTVGAEIARPKTAAEVQENVAETMIDGYKAKDKDLDYLFQLLDDGKLADIDLGPLGSIGLGNMTQQRKEEIKAGLLSIKSAEKTAKSITNFATVKALQEESTKNIANLNAEINAMYEDPMHDQKLLDKKIKELDDQIIINQVSNNTQKPFEKQKLEKDINDAAAAIGALSFNQRAYIGTKNASLDIAELGMSMLNSIGEAANKYSPTGIRVYSPSVMNALEDGSPGSILKTFAKNKRDELEEYKKSNKTEYLAGQASILDGLNAVNAGKAIGQTLGSMGAVIAGSIAAGPAGGIAVGYSLVYGDAVDAARKAGFNETEAEIYGQVLAIGSGLLEELPVGKLLEGWTNTMLKKSILNLIRTDLKAGVPKKEIIKKITDQTIETAVKAIQQGVPEGTTEVLQGTQEYLTQAAFNNFLQEKEDPGFELPTLKQFGKQSAEAFVLGFFGGGGASVVGDVMSGTQSYSKLAASAIRDNEAFNNLNLVADGLLTTGKITKQERDSFVENLKIAKEAKAALPKYIKDDNVRQRSIELILEKKRLEADMATVDPSMQDGYKAKLTSIQSELKSIADQKWKAPANPVIFSSVSGLEAMTTSLVNNSSKENSAGTFVSTVESGKGFINDLIKSLDENEPVAKPLIDRTVKSLETLAKTFAEAPVKTEMTQKAAQQAQELADQLKSYSNISESVEEKVIPGLDISLAADRIALGVPIADLDFMGDVPVDIQEAYQGIMSGDEVSSEDANNVQNVLYAKYKELSDIKQRVQDKLENTTSKDKQRKLTESINAISEIQANLSEDIGMIGRYRDETRIKEEATGQVQETKTKPVVKQETKKEQAKPSQKLSEQELADMEYDYSNPSEAVTSMIDSQPDASKIYKLLNGAIKFINKIAPNAKVYVHATSQEFYDAVDSTSGSKNQRLADDGIYVGGVDGKPKAIHFNLEVMLGKKDPKKREEALRTFAHEAMHVGLQSIFGNDQKLFQSFQDKLSKVLGSADLAFLNDFVELYKGEDYTSEEFLAELGGMMSAEGRKIPKPILARVAQLINNTITAAARTLKIPVDSNLLFKNTNDANDIIDFFNTMAESTRTGITQEVQGKAEPLLKQQTKQANETEQPTGTRARTAAEEQRKPAPAGNRLFNEPLADAKRIADKYFESTFGRKKPNYTGTRFLDVENAKRLSDAFIAMKHAPQDFEVAKAYRQMIKETEDQYKAIVDAGYSVVINNTEPYKNSDQMINDLRKNKSVKIFSTESAFGDTPITEEQRRDNPLLARTEFKDANGVPLLANDLFRFVHDFFGHSELGNSFGAKGEENAWNVHARMYSPLARRAMTTETRGQNSYVNFSGINEKVDKLREKVRKQREDGDEEGAMESANELYELTKFADQKVGLLPEEFSQIDETNEGDRHEELGLPVPITRARATAKAPKDIAGRVGREGGLINGTNLQVTGKEQIKPGKTTFTIYEAPTAAQKEKGNFTGKRIETFGLEDIKKKAINSNSAIVNRAEMLSSGLFKYKYEEIDENNKKTGKKISGEYPLPYSNPKANKNINKLVRQIKAIPGKNEEEKAEKKRLLTKLKKEIIPVYQDVINTMAENIRALFDTLTPEFIEQSKRWYEGANRFANSLASTYKISVEQSSGMLAVLSPQKDWFNNVSAAERVMDIITNHSDKPFTKELLDNAVKYNTKGGKVPNWVNDIKKQFKTTEGMSINDMQKEGVSIAAQANLLRILDHYYNSPNVLQTTPDGQVIGYGESTIMWNPASEIGRAMMIFRDPAQANIDVLLGEGNKVRNFYNNIVDPNSENGYLTADTHALGVAFGLPTSANDAGAFKLFSGGEESIYAIVKDAYTIVAKEMGMLPRELQSITWEAFRTGVNDKNRTKAKNKSNFDMMQTMRGQGVGPYKITQAIINENRSTDPEWAKELGINTQKRLSEIRRGAGRETQQGVGEDVSVRGQQRERDGGADTSMVPDAARETVTRARKTQVDKALEAYPELATTKVVNEDGTPKILYHGGLDFKGFKKGETKGDAGIYFTDNPDFALYFAHQAELYERDKRNDDYRDVPERLLETGEPFPEKYFKYAKVQKVYLDMKNPKVVDALDARAIPNAYGKNNDGFIAKTTGDFGYKGGQYVVFEPSKIKDADPKVIDSIIEEQPTTRARKTQIDKVFEENPELASIGSPDQYSNYLDSIFPESQLKDIFYHGSSNKFTEFRDPSSSGLSHIWFSEKPLIGQYGNYIYPVILDIKSPLSEWSPEYRKEINLFEAAINPERDYALTGELAKYKYDSTIRSSRVDNGKSITVRNPKQIHILGSKKDIDGFKSFVNSATTTRARKTQSNQQYYNPAKAADQGTKADRDNQVKIYDKAKAFIDNFIASGGDVNDIQTALFIDLTDNGIDIDANDLFQLRYDVTQGNRPKFAENKGGQGYAYQEGTKNKKSRVLERIKTKLEKLSTNKGLNRKIINKLKESLHYTVQNQDDAMRIAQMVVDEFGGIDGPQDVQDLYDLSNEFSGAVKTFIVGNVLNEAYKNAKKAAKGSAEQLRYQEIINSSSSLLAERARDNGREIAALYKLYLNSPEGMYTIEAKKYLQEVEAAFGSKSQKDRIDKLLKNLKDAKDEAARLATEVASVKAAIAAATGGPTTPTAPKPTTPKPPKPQTTPTTPTQANLKKERSLFQQLKDRLKTLGNTRSRRQYAAGVDPDVVDILAELARVNFERGIFDFYDIKDAIAKKLAKDNMSISDAHYTEMWNDIWREANNAQIAFNAEILAKRIIFKADQTAQSSAPMTDPIKLIKDELFRRATQDFKDLPDLKESEYNKLRTLLIRLSSLAKPIWNESKDAVERQIEALDPTKYSDAAKAELRRKLDNFFNDTIANSLPRSEKKITATFAEDVKDKELKIQDILLLPNETIASNREEFVKDLVDRLVSQTGISYSDAQAITEAFTKEYDKLAQKTSEKILARSIPKNKNKDKILNKSNAEKAFEMIKYGAIDQNASITDKDGNLTDLNNLFSDIFGLPKMNDEIRGNLKVFAEQIAKTKPNSILRQQFYNDMMSYIEFQKIRDSMGLNIFMSQIYHNVLFSMDTMIKAFNSNIINTPHEFVTQALRAFVEGDFSLIPLLAKSYFGRKGDKTSEVWFREGFNNAKLTLAGMVETENFNTSNTAEVLSKYSDSPSLRAWGKYARKSNRFLGSIDTLFTSAATGARISDLLYDEIKYLAKQNNVKLSSREIADTVANIQGIKFTPGITNSPVKDAIAQATDEFVEAYGQDVDINSKKNIALFRARVMEIVRNGARERAADYIVRNGWASELDGARIDEIISTAKELASKVGLVGNPPGTFGVLAHMLKLPGKAMPGSQVIVGNMFANAPMNAAEKILQGNTLVGGIVLAIRLTKNQRGILSSKEAVSQFYDKEGIRSEMYGRITSTMFGREVNMEKKELIVRYVMLQAAVLPISYFSTIAIAGAIAKAMDDDDERKEDLIKNDIAAIGKISEKERHMLFFGDKTAEAGTKEYNGQWKNLKLYVTGPMYGYTERGAYSKMSALKSMYGIEPYSVYCYGRLVTRYNDNPILAAVFGGIGANNDVVLFNNNPEKPTETYTQMMMQSSFLQLNLVKDQAAIKPVMEFADAFGGTGAYSAPDLDNISERAKLLAEKKIANLVSNITLPAEAKNFNQDIKSFMGVAADDPRELYEFLVFRAPIADSIIRNDKTDSFGFPIEEKTKRVLPVGTQGLLYAKGPDGVLQFPQVDQIMNGPGGKYYALFMKYDNDRYDKPGISTYIERDPDNSGNSRVRELTKPQLDLVRDEYKKMMRDFADANFEEFKSGMTKMEFDLQLDLYLSFYNENIDGYKDYILKKVVGENAFVDEPMEESINEGIDEQFRTRE